MKSIAADKLKVLITDTRLEMGASAAFEVARRITELLKRQEEVRMIFAAAPSQNEFLASFTQRDIPWNRIVAFHMDEYIGLPSSAPQLFRAYLTKHLFSCAPFRAVHLMDPSASDPAKECERYGALVAQKPIDIVCMGIGENGHVAFNDPPVADFNDPKVAKVVELDEPCRHQQVNDGCFPTFKDVPTHAMTLTVPTLMSGGHLSIVVPGALKAEAVRKTIHDPISTACPSTILRTHANATLYLDEKSADRLSRGA